MLQLSKFNSLAKKTLGATIVLPKTKICGSISSEVFRGQRMNVSWKQTLPVRTFYLDKFVKRNVTKPLIKRFHSIRPVHTEASSVPENNHIAKSNTPFSTVIANTTTGSAKRGADKEKLNLTVGDELHGYRVKEVTPVPERNLTAILLEHVATGAEHLHIDCVDTNNTFCVIFKTIPKNSTGVAHILEHTTLCGSKKYPVRDPFFNMIKRSLNTYMNAWTGADYTAYPFASQNEKDFANLLSVYLDATFFPNLEKVDFMQEGHRLEFENPADPNSPLLFKGVVYNEMKGSMSDPVNLFSHRFTEKLFPGTTYANNSGGEPKDIPNLTYEQLQEFHRVHYHPSNARFITYGDLPLANHLKFIHENGLSSFGRIDPKTRVEDVARYTTPQKFEMSCPPAASALLCATMLLTHDVVDENPDKQTKLVVTYTKDPYETFYMDLLSTLLLDGPNAPMYKALIDSNIGSDYAPSTGYDHHTKYTTLELVNMHDREGHFGIGLQGIKQEDVPTVLQLIDSTLQQVAKEGFEQKRIDSIIHQLEINQKNVTTNFGLRLVSALTSHWIHGGNPIELLHFNKFIDKLKADLATGSLFQDKIKKYFLSNPHKVTLIMNPDAKYVANEAEEENKKLAHIRATLTEKQKAEIIALQEELKRRQDIKQGRDYFRVDDVDVSVLPTVTLQDIPKTVLPTETSIKRYGDRTAITWCPQPTNGLVYYRALMPIPDLPKELLSYLPLFCSVLPRIGTTTKHYRELAHEIELYTGGISANTHLFNKPEDLLNLEGYLYLYGMSLERNSERLFALLQDIIKNPIFTEQEFLKTNINQKMASMQDSLMSEGHSYASSYAASPFRKYHLLNELWGGISQFMFIQELASKEDLSEVTHQLQELAKNILSTGFTKCMVNAEEKVFSSVEKQMSALLESIPSRTLKTNIGDVQQSSASVKTFFSVPGLVNYVAKCIPTVPYTHPDSAKLQILSRLISKNFLHTELREKGGAYGGGASSSSGLFQFYSYRDPNVQKTLTTFDRSLDWVMSNKFTDQDLQEAKLTVFADLDTPIPPSDKGTLDFTLGITHAMRQARRNQFFEITKKDMTEVAEKYLTRGASIAVVGSENALEQIKQDSSWEIRS